MSSNEESYHLQQTQYQQQYDPFRQQAGQQPQSWNDVPPRSNDRSPQIENSTSSHVSQALDPSYSPSLTAFSATNSLYHNKIDEPKDGLNSMRRINRTPSPTPSERKALDTDGAIDWKTVSKWRFWIRREWLWYYVALIVILIITALIAIYHIQIVHWLTPMTRWLHDSNPKVGWLVPMAVLFVISFPPLFGHEIVAMLCGLVWGMWVGFGIVAAGTYLGEVGNFYAFRYCCRARGEKYEKTKIPYACLAKIVREGGFKIALIARLSAIPGHFTTAVFSTCGMGIIVFSLAAILSMPKQFIIVYLGVILEQSSNGEQDSKSRLITGLVVGITFPITFGAMWYIFREMRKVKPQVIYERRKARSVLYCEKARFLLIISRQAKLNQTFPEENSRSSISATLSNDVPLDQQLRS